MILLRAALPGIQVAPQLLDLLLQLLIIITITNTFTISIISSSTQQSSRGPVDEMHVFQKKMFSLRPEATFQVNFNAKTHLF